MLNLNRFEVDVVARSLHMDVVESNDGRDQCDGIEESRLRDYRY
jgi:hypothetical protein